MGEALSRIKSSGRGARLLFRFLRLCHPLPLHPFPYDWLTYDERALTHGAEPRGGCERGTYVATCIIHGPNKPFRLEYNSSMYRIAA